MEMRGMARRRRLLAAEAAAVVLVSMLVLSTDLASNGGSLSASMAPEVFCAKNSSYGSELHARDSCGDPGTAHAVQSSTSNLSSMVTTKSFGPSVTDLDPLLMNGDYIGHPYFSEDHSKTYDMVFPNKTSPHVHDVFIDAILDIVEGYEDSHTVEWWYEDSMEMEEECEACLVKGREGYYVGFRTVSEDWSSLELADNDSKRLFNKKNDSKPLIQWIFLKPLTKELWLATVCFVFFTGFVFWMIERSINPTAFRGSSLAQFSTALYFVFSTLTFSHGQILRSPLSRIVLVVWCFAVLVLVQSYLATLSSMLAAEASANNVSNSAASPAPLTLRSLSGLFVVTGCIFAFMLLLSFTRWVYRVRGSESQSADGSVRPEEFSTPQNHAANGSVVVPDEQAVQEVRDNDSQGGAHMMSSAISRDEEAGGAMQDSMFDASEPAPDVYVQIEMTSTSNGVSGAL